MPLKGGNCCFGWSWERCRVVVNISLQPPGLCPRLRCLAGVRQRASEWLSVPILLLGLQHVSEIHGAGAGASVPGGGYNCQPFAMFKLAKGKNLLTWAGVRLSQQEEMGADQFRASGTRLWPEVLDLCADLCHLPKAWPGTSLHPAVTRGPLRNQLNLSHWFSCVVKSNLSDL